MTGVTPVALDGVIDEHFLMRYRTLRDEEAAAFEGLEHAFEDGDRDRFVVDLEAWTDAIGRKIAYLRRKGLEPQAVPALG